MTMKPIYIACSIACAGVATIAIANPTHNVPPAKAGGTVVELCDGETSVEVQGEMTHDKAQATSDALMKQWKQKHPHASWDVADTGNAGAPKGKQPASQADTYGGYDAR